MKLLHPDYPCIRWLPKNPAVIWRYHHKLLVELIKEGVCSAKLDSVDHKQFAAVILDFKRLIEEDSEINRDFHEMFEQVLPRPQGEGEDENKITDYMLLLGALNKTIATAPSFHWSDDPKDKSQQLIAGVPMYGVIGPFANTEAGYRAFTNPKVNDIILRIFNEWSRFLVSPGSRNVLVDSEDGWFGPKALEVQADRLGAKFEDVWVCKPNEPNWGFGSWDEFFVRRFREKQRDIIDPYNKDLIIAPCEAIELRYCTEVKANDTFWIKEQPYSLIHSLNNDPLATQFVNGTVYQAVLSSLDYHRWHSPVGGRIINAYVVPGSYYAAIVDDDNDIDVITRSIYFQTAMTTRAFIFIESDNPSIGLMCFVGVGLAEVSTCRLEVRQGDRVEKGQEIGSFRFGGSTHLLIFRPETKLEIYPGPDQPPEPEPRVPRLVNSTLFKVLNQ